MKRLARLTGAALLAILAGCETTGNPREGGLFGWSETKAQERQAQKRASVAVIESELTKEQARSETLQARNTTADQNNTRYTAQQANTEKFLRAQRDRLVAKTERLEEASPTAATASRARAYRRDVNTTAANTSLTPQRRAERLHALEKQIDAAQAQFTR